MLAETVYAVGNAFGYEDTITEGIVSALHRDVEVDETQSYENLIQTSASINPGNSGGPLLNLNGEVIGINVAIRSGAQRIGFAIPIDDARKTIARLMSVEKLNGLPHGLSTEDVKSAAEKKLVVQEVHTGSAADLCGIKPGDVIRSVRGLKIHDGTDFERALLDQPQVELSTWSLFVKAASKRCSSRSELARNWRMPLEHRRTLSSREMSRRFPWHHQRFPQLFLPRQRQQTIRRRSLPSQRHSRKWRRLSQGKRLMHRHCPRFLCHRERRPQRPKTIQV